MRKGLATVAVVVAVVTAGCQKLNYAETAEVKAQGNPPWSKGFTPPAYDQDVTVTIEPETCSVSAYLVSDANKQALEDFLIGAAPGKAPDPKLVLDGKTFKPSDSKQDYTFTAKVPAKTGYWIIVNGGKQTTKVKVKVVGK